MGTLFLPFIEKDDEGDCGGEALVGMGRFWTFCPLRDLSVLRGPYGETFTEKDNEEVYGKALREGPLRGGFLREAF